jgi:hypothetical protein
MKNIKKNNQLKLAIQSSETRSELKNNSVSYTTDNIQEKINKINISENINEKNNENVGDERKLYNEIIGKKFNEIINCKNLHLDIFNNQFRRVNGFSILENLFQPNLI